MSDPIATTLATSDIVSLAFLAMEKTPPASFADATEEATLTTQFYPAALERCLEQNDWSFASTYAALPPLTLPATSIADPALPYTYALPGDCLRLREVGDGCTRWRLDKLGDVRALRADQAAPLPVRYTARVFVETLLPVSFRNLVALQLAVYLAPRFLGTASKIEVLKRDLSDALEAAQREDSRSASDARYDGLDISYSDDWVTEARA
jgi:hypothetical protein